MTSTRHVFIFSLLVTLMLPILAHAAPAHQSNGSRSLFDIAISPNGGALNNGSTTYTRDHAVGLAPANEASPPASSASGGEIDGGITYDDVTNTLTYDFAYGAEFGFTDLVGNFSAVHFHAASASQYDQPNVNAGVIYNLASDHTAGSGSNPKAGRITGSQILTDVQEQDLFDNEIYINIHSSFAGGGEIRGQLIPVQDVTPIVVDGDLSETSYQTIATKQNANSGFGTDIDVSEIKFLADETNDILHIGVEGKLDTGSDNGIGIWLDFSSLTGVPAGTELGFDGGGHYIDGEDNGTNDDFKADFEVDYMFALNPGSGSTSVFFDAAKVVGGNTAGFVGSSNQSGTATTTTDTAGGVFADMSSLSFAFNNSGGADQGFELSIPMSKLGLSGTNIQMKAFAFVVSETGFFSDVTVPGDVPDPRANPGFNADFGAIGTGPFNSGNSAPTAVRLEYFTATANSDGSVTLDWETSFEHNHSGFNVRRRPADTQTSWTQINTDGVIPSTGTQAQGQTYQFIDNSVDAGRWEYLLEDVETDGTTYQHTNFITSVATQAPTAVSLVGINTTISATVGFILMGLFLATGLSLLIVKKQR